MKSIFLRIERHGNTLVGKAVFRGFYITVEGKDENELMASAFNKLRDEDELKAYIGPDAVEFHIRYAHQDNLA